MKLNKGLYEHVITKELNEEINQKKDTIDVFKDTIDSTVSNQILSDYVSSILKKGLNYFKSSKEDLKKQIDIVNNLIDVFSESIEDEDFRKYVIDESELLRGIFDKEITKKNSSKIIPLTSIANSSLFTGSQREPTVFSEINKEIASADRVDLLVSFIKYSGLRLILGALIEHTKTKKLRVLTTSYMGATDFKAIKVLAELPNTEIKISYDTERTRLHAKTYYFHRETGFSTAYIGSSNMSKAALSEGTEWNMKISEYTSLNVIEKYRITFETYWNSKDFMYFDTNNVNDARLLKQSLSRETSKEDLMVSFDIRPYSYQQEILDKLKVEREIFNSKRNLIVAATGTGKTVVSAFDFKDYYKKHQNCRLLFLAHRKEILQQSIMTFRWILKDQNFGDLWVGEYSPSMHDHLFASIQTLKVGTKYKLFSEEYFDFVIIDETHHGTAESYNEIISYFKPDILVGLTATPERMDGGDILQYFNNRIAYEIRLHEAIDRSLLCPFHYFGVTDNVDIDAVKWARGKYEICELNNLYTGNDKRADLIVRALDRYITDIDAVKGLGFCVSKEHAKFMNYYFNKIGIPAMNLDSDSSIEERNNAKRRLIKGDIKFIFVVDLYNEGVDIPEINTVLFLRPTESATVFIQQLGRGLRLAEDKDVLTVLDFIGQANKEFNYRTKLRSIIGKTNNAIEEEVAMNFPALPSGCFMQLEKKAKEYILNNIKQTYANKHNIIRMIRYYVHETNNSLTLGNFLRHYQLEPWQIYKISSFGELCSIANDTKEYVITDSKELSTTFKRVMHVNSLKLIDFLLDYLQRDTFSLVELSEEQEIMLLMFHYTVWNDSPQGDLLRYLNRLRQDNRQIFDEIIELLKYNREQINFIEEDVDLGYTCPLELYATYSTDQILAALGEHTLDKKQSFREGVKYLKEKNTDIFFITLTKSEKHFSATTQYDDYAISERLFHWQSQSRTSDISPTGQRYINQRKDKNKILLFIREYRSENSVTSPFYFLGKANYVSHKGSKPISIILEMEKPIPAFILKKSNKIVNAM
jgi:superfamily II DNA or RNA helicase